PEVDTELDPIALHHYFSFHSVVPAPLTLFKGIRKLEPGHFIEIASNGSVKNKPYWEVSFQRDPEKANWSDEKWQAEIEIALKAAVKRRLVADVPVGVFLSGGIDSSLITALMAKQAPHRLETFSIGFQNTTEEDGNEFKY